VRHGPERAWALLRLSNTSMQTQTNRCSRFDSHRPRVLRSRGYTACALILGLALPAGVGCGSDSVTLSSPIDPVGTIEHDRDASVRVDPAGISGSLEGTRVRAEIPLEGLMEGAGSIDVSLRSVDDAESFSSVRLDYVLKAGEQQRVEAALELPAPSDQSGLVKYNVVVASAGQLLVKRSLQQVVPPYEVAVEGPSRLSAGKQVSYRLSTRSPLTRAPIGGQPVVLELTGPSGAVERYPAVTDENGAASVELSAALAGDYSARASAQAFGVATSLEESVQVAASARRLLLTTDKPIYKPGQTLHLRALSLAASDRRPNRQEPLTLEVEDGKGNKILKKALSTDDYGIAATDFTLGSVLNQGTFKVRAISGDTTTEKTVRVYEYALPKLDFAVHTDRPWYLAGQSAVLQLDAHYFFGKPVALADAAIELYVGAIGEGQLFGRVQSRTDAAGKLETTVQLPSTLPGLAINGNNGLVYLSVTVTDSAGQTVTKQVPVTVAADALSVALVPESGQLVANIENEVDVFVSDPVGSPVADAAVDVSVGATTLSVVTDAFGHARLSWVPAPDQREATVHVSAGGQEHTEEFGFEPQQGNEHLLVRTERAVYDVGDSIDVEILTTGDEVVYVDWLNDGQAVDMRTLKASGGSAHFSMPVDASLLGENRIEAYVVDDDGNVVRSGRTLFARGGTRLQIAMTSDRATYTPGSPARLSFSVTDESGAPQVAALGVQIVDQAVFAVTDAKPGLLATYFELEDDFATPSYEMHAPGGDMTSLLLEQTASADAPTRDAAQVRAAANLAARVPGSITGLQGASWAATVQASQALLAPLVEVQRKSLFPQLAKAARAGIDTLRGTGCSPEGYYCASLDLSFPDALAAEIGRTFTAYDFWGNAYVAGSALWGEAGRWVSAGPDERAGTADDLSIAVRFDELGLESLGLAFATGVGEANAGGAQPPAAGQPNFNQPVNSPADLDGSTASGGPRVRQDFPETLYDNPSIITDASGHASIDLDLADSITEWRVSALGNSADGKLGGSVNGVTVFQDFFVDVGFPATLTRGDEVSFPIAVYNYLDTPQTVALKLEPSDWYTSLGATALSVDLGPGEVRGVSLPVRVEGVGVQTLTVTGTGTGTGTGVSDAVARRVRVVPDGKAFPTALSGSIEAGNVSHTLSFPAGAVPGSEQLYLNVYPAFFAQAVSGMDSVLSVPNGCFEQTTSTTWPNVLVTRYMQATGQITPEIQLRAESLISAGYQRLLTFEHPGGGYSWFGVSDGAPYLSVTAFGLMEFADMKAVHPIDEAMLARTQSWLISQQQADGSWVGGQTEFFSFNTSLVRNTAFVLWALAENGYNGPAVAPALAYIKGHLDADASEKDDPYTLGLVANALVMLGDPAANALLARIDAVKQADADKFYWPSQLQTDFYGGGRDADVTATALITHALLRANAYASTVQGALAFITGAKDAAGNFGSTQATTWSLKALMLAASRGTDGAVGTLQVSLDGEPYTTVNLQADQSDVMTTVDMSALATSGDHTIDLGFIGTGRVSYNLVGSHNLPWSALPPEPTGPIGIEVAYDQTAVTVDASVAVTARIENRTDDTTHMLLVTLGIPAGFEVTLSDFDSYIATGVLSKAEVTGKQLILYVSELGAHQSQAFAYSLRATLPVRASDGGAEVSLYYEPEKKTQAPETTLIVSEH
jgi:alpha-2-macroglobulin-like protein